MATHWKEGNFWVQKLEKTNHFSVFPKNVRQFTDSKETESMENYDCLCRERIWYLERNWFKTEKGRKKPTEYRNLLYFARHHKRKGRHPRLSSLPPQRSSEKLPETNYASTFKAVADPRPRSSKRPPMSPRNPNPPNMSFETHQRSEFKNYGEIERRKPIYTVSKQIDH